MNREPVGDVSAGAVDVESNRSGVVVGQLAKALDHSACCIFFDVADEVDVAQTIGSLLTEDSPDSIDQLADQTFVQLTERDDLSYLGPLSFGRRRLVGGSRNGNWGVRHAVPSL